MDALLERFASDDWIEIEKKWKNGLISSKECLDLQLSLVKISKKELDDFISSIEIDKSFFDFIEFVKTNYNAKIYILSDGFRLFIKKILKQHIEKIDKIYANNLYFINKSFKTLYRYSKPDCKMGVCKCSVLNNLKSNTNIYIGDGFSDFCACVHADFIFAKGKLFEFLKNSNINHFTMFSSFDDIIYQLPFVLERLHGKSRAS